LYPRIAIPEEGLAASGAQVEEIPRGIDGAFDRIAILLRS